MPTAENVIWMKKDTMTKRYELTEEEKAHAAEDMARIKLEIAKLQAEAREAAADYKGQITVQEKALNELASLVRDGEDRKVTCDLFKDYGKEEMVWIEAAEPHAEIFRRQMTEEEKQPSLPFGTFRREGKKLDA